MCELTDERQEYEGNPEQSLSTLLCVSIPMLYGGDRFRIEAAKMRDRDHLKAIKNQAEQSAGSLRWLLGSLGICMAIANESENMPRDAMVSIGWGINFLSDLQEGLESVRSTAEYWLSLETKRTALREKYGDPTKLSPSETEAFLRDAVEIPECRELIISAIERAREKKQEVNDE